MSQYMITYLGGDHPSSPAEGQKHFAKYKEWLASLGEAAVSPANPLKGTSTVNPDGSAFDSQGLPVFGVRWFTGSVRVNEDAGLSGN